MNIKNLFKYIPPSDYDFTLTPYNSNSIKNNNTTKNIYPNIEFNLNYIKQLYNVEINSDIMIREFSLNVRNITYKAFILYIDGMVDADLINRFILDPLMLHDDKNTFLSKKFNLENYIYTHLIPQNNLDKASSFSDIAESVNSGNCALFIDTVNIAFDIDVKGFKQRSVDTPNNEAVIKGPQEAFVENIRTNTSLLRRIANNENLIVESVSIGNISKTKIAVCYMSNIANPKLVGEVKYRLSNIEVDSLISTGQLEQFITDSDVVGIPNLLSTERPDKCAKFMMQGRVIVLVNGNPYAIVAPAVITDFLYSPEDTNLKVLFANFLKTLRLLAYFITLLGPGLFIAITCFHQEILPTELLFSILASRKSVPFPVIFELLLMEISFELIRESGLRMPSALGATLGIVGALILGDAAVTAHIVSPILIIVVAITGLSSFAIPDFTFSFHLRIYRFLFIFLGYTAGFLGISVGLIIYINLLCSMKSFGVDFIAPLMSRGRDSGYFVTHTWKKEKRAKYILPRKETAQPNISKKWSL